MSGPRRAPPSVIGAFLLALLALASACGDDADEGAEDSTGANAPPAEVSGRLSVFAAASLTESFRAIGEAFERANPEADVEFNFGSSSAIATQIEQSAPADVFASADMPQMQRLVDRGLIEGAPVTFARNMPVIVVPGSGAKVTAPRDLANSGVKLVLAAADVPIGSYSRQIIDKLAADPAYGAAFKDAALKNIVSHEANVRAVLTKVELAEADAGIVYRTDALVAKDRVKTVAIPDTANVIATYPIALVKGARNTRAAAAFVAFVRGPEAQTMLVNAGFDRAP